MPSHRVTGFAVAAVLGIAALVMPEISRAGDLEQQRSDYRAAMRALEKGQLTRYNTLRKRLDGYILSGYLDYEFLKGRVATASPERIRSFLAANTDAPTSVWLRNRWLEHLAKQKQWKTFLAEYRPVDAYTDLRCLRLEHLTHTARSPDDLIEEFHDLWLVGASQPKECDPLFSAWRRKGWLDRELVWARIGLAMQRGRSNLAVYLARTYLSGEDVTWARRWQAMHRAPAASLDRIDYSMDSPLARSIVRHGVVRLARRDPVAAMDMWQDLKQSHNFLGEDDDYVLRYAGLRAAQQHRPEAVKWLSAVVADDGDDELRLWRVRAALRARDWRAARQFIASIPESQRTDGQWRYLQARALDATGAGDQARALYAGLAGERSYYGFLAADHLGQDYAIHHAGLQATKAEVDGVANRRSVRVARELFEIGTVIPARRQWEWAIRDLDDRELQVAALLASQWGWHDRALITVRRSTHHDDLDILYPILYREHVDYNAQLERIDPEWIYGVVRQESAFISDARSSAGALGLMQLMPYTGREVSRRLKLNVRNRHQILDIGNNIRLGSNYLKTVLEKNDGNVVLATASYNAGPRRVREWLPAEGALDADVWIESIPFNETRNYVKNVLGFTTIYDHRLGQDPQRLIDRMPPIASRTD